MSMPCQCSPFVYFVGLQKKIQLVEVLTASKTCCSNIVPRTASEKNVVSKLLCPLSVKVAADLVLRVVRLGNVSQAKKHNCRVFVPELGRASTPEHAIHVFVRLCRLLKKRNCRKRSGERSFPRAACALQRLPQAAGAAVSAATSSLQEQTRALCQPLKEAQHGRLAALQEMRKNCLGVKPDSAEILQDRRQLQQCSTWHAIPHSCSAVQSVVTSVKAVENIQHTEVSTLAAAWEQSHELISHIPTGLDAKLSRENKCWQENICSCGPENRALLWMWAALQNYVKASCRLPEEVKRLQQGYMMLLWQSFHPDVEVEDAVERQPLAQAVVAIPLHYLAPWRPTLLAMDALAEDNDGQRRLPVNEPNLYATVTVKFNNAKEPRFISALRFISIMDLAQQWRCTLLEVSERDRPFHAPYTKLKRSSSDSANAARITPL
eukprot:6459781-Amphidinium_carterae.3